MTTPHNSERESMEVDVVIVGAGPAGLATACRLMQLCQERDLELSVVVLEKAASVGGHIISGAVIEPTALNELFPDWADLDAPLKTPVSRDEIFFFSSGSRALKVPEWMAPRTMRNHGNYIVSLAQLVRWLGEQAEGLGVEVYPGFAASEVLFDADGSVMGVATGDMGVSKSGERKSTYEPGMELHAKFTVFAEGCRGHLGKQMIERFSLDEGKSPQHYGIGLKELWRVEASTHEPGLVVHSAGWPLSEHGASGGAFLYHLEDQQVALGIIVDLNYDNPYLSPFDELQRFKTHSAIRPTLVGGERLSYGARAISKGGLNSLPSMSMPGAFLIGCDAGTLNFSKIKGTHTAMKSGMIAAETIAELLHGGDATSAKDLYETNLKESWLYSELKASRNFGPAIHKFGPYIGGAFNTIDQNWFGGKMPVNITDTKHDHACLKNASEVEPIHYPKPDGALTFDKNSSVFLTNTNHEADQPIHLRLTDSEIPIQINLPKWAEPAQRYCPAGVYEILEEDSKPVFQINAQNCIHCKTCDIKDPSQNITWLVPEGGGGPKYPAM